MNRNELYKLQCFSPSGRKAISTLFWCKDEAEKMYFLMLDFSKRTGKYDVINLIQYNAIANGQFAYKHTLQFKDLTK